MKKLFDEISWIGEFFVENDKDNRFFGKLDYSPITGISLSYFIPRKYPKGKHQIIFGKLNDGNQCTLICNAGFKFDKSSKILSNDGIFSYGHISLELLVLGMWITKDEKIYGLGFYFESNQDFFKFLELKKSNNDFSSELASIKLNSGHLYLREEQILQYTEGNFSGKISGRPEKNMELIEESFGSISELLSSNKNFSFTQNTEYGFYLENEDGMSLNELTAMYSELNQVTELLTLLLNNTVYPTSISINCTAIGKLNYSSLLYSNIPRHENIVQKWRAGSDYTEQYYVLNHSAKNGGSKLNFTHILQTWLSLDFNCSSLIQIIQNNPGYIYNYNLYSEVIIHATKLEEISKETNSDKKMKYTEALKIYASNAIEEELSSIFLKYGSDDIGQGISTLRGDIAHSKDIPNILNKLSAKELFRIVYCMRLTILGYTFNKLEIHKYTTSLYQDYFIKLQKSSP